jgi:TPR repeat protein
MSKSLMYRRNWGGRPKDDVQAASWFLKAAEAGSTVGMNNVGFLYENGTGGLSKSAAQAITWHRRAANLGQAQAEASLKRLRDVVSNAAGA